MIIYSWNILFDNKKIDEAIDFVKNSDFDIFCFQEVSQKALLELQKLDCYLAYVDEVFLETKSREFPIHSVILSKFPIVHTYKINFSCQKHPPRSYLTRYFMDILSKVERITNWRNRSSLYVDIRVSEKLIRIFSLHLELSQPKQRMDELRLAMKSKTDFTIVCGDFNVLEKFYISVLNWLLGGTLRDWFNYKQERKNMEKYFHSLDLVNPLKDKITHSISRSQLDHILVPKLARVKHATVIADSYGSDHKPVEVEIDL